MLFEEANNLGDRICAFILSCGGAYTGLNAEIERSVFYALGSNQYILKEDNGEIIYFASYWKIHQADVQAVMGRVLPGDVSHGSVLYVTEAACRGGRKETAEMIRRLREQAAPFHGAFWHRPAKADQIYHFPRQRGKEARR